MAGQKRVSATFGVASGVVWQHLAAGGIEAAAPALCSEEGQGIIFLLQVGGGVEGVSFSCPVCLPPLCVTSSDCQTIRPRLSRVVSIICRLLSLEVILVINC